MYYGDEGIGRSSIMIYTTEDGLLKIETIFEGEYGLVVKGADGRVISERSFGYFKTYKKYI